jgi:hypothetical protein
VVASLFWRATTQRSFFEAIFQSVDVDAFEPNEWIADGDVVVSLGEFECRVRATGKLPAHDGSSSGSFAMRRSLLTSSFTIPHWRLPSDELVGFFYR